MRMANHETNVRSIALHHDPPNESPQVNSFIKNGSNVSCSFCLDFVRIAHGGGTFGNLKPEVKRYGRYEEPAAVDELHIER